MSLAILTGDGTELCRGVARALPRLQFEVVHETEWTGEPASLLVIVVSNDRADRFDLEGSADPLLEIGADLQGAADLVLRFAKASPAPERDATGEWRTQAAVISVIDQPPHMAVPESASFGVLTDALISMTRIMAAQLAPRVRVNAIVPERVMPIRNTAAEAQRDGLAPRLDPDGLLPSLAHLATMPAMTGQIISLRSQI